MEQQITSQQIKSMILSQIGANLRYVRGFMFVNEYGVSIKFVIDVWSDPMLLRGRTRPCLMDTYTNSEVKVDVPHEVLWQGKIAVYYERIRAALEADNDVYKELINGL